MRCTRRPSQSALTEAGFDVAATAADPSLRGSGDADLLDHATATSRALVTENVSDLLGARPPAGLSTVSLMPVSSSRTRAVSTGRPSPIPAI